MVGLCSLLLLLLVLISTRSAHYISASASGEFGVWMFGGAQVILEVSGRARRYQRSKEKRVTQEKGDEKMRS